jgi:hypothetical protein
MGPTDLLAKFFPDSGPKPLCPFRNDAPCTDKCALYVPNTSFPDKGVCAISKIADSKN